MTLNHILNEIDLYILENDEDIKEIYKNKLFSMKEDNLNDLYINTKDCYRYEDNILLSGNEEINAKYLLYSYTGHNGTSILYECDSLEEIENDILSGAGILNYFSTYEIPIIEGKYKNYKVFTLNDNGNKIIFDQNNYDLFNNKKVFIEWL